MVERIRWWYYDRSYLQENQEMPLTCTCYWEPEPGDYIWYDPDGYETLGPPIKRRQRCCSCNNLIGLGETVARTQRSKVPSTEVECAIYGEGEYVPLADKFLCETCADLFFSLKELGFCVYAGEPMKELVKEYAESRRTS